MRFLCILTAHPSEWQVRLCYYSYLKVKERFPDSAMGGFTRLLHTWVPAAPKHPSCAPDKSGLGTALKSITWLICKQASKDLIQWYSINSAYSEIDQYASAPGVSQIT